MATILLVEDSPDLGLYEAGLLEQAGHTLLRCSGSPSLFGACPMLKYGSCELADAAELILFSCSLVPPMHGRSYRGVDLLRAYRTHPLYGRKPMVVVSLGTPDDLGGIGPIEQVDKFSEPHVVIEAVERVLAAARPTVP